MAAGDERELAEDCWTAIRILTHDRVVQETPEWLAATASLLPTSMLPEEEIVQ